MQGSAERLFEFKFFDGQVFRGRGISEKDALVRLGLGAYNPVAYDVRELVSLPDSNTPDGEKAPKLQTRHTLA